MLMSLRLFTRAPCARIRPWLSATCSAGDGGSVLVAMLMVSPRRRSSVLKQQPEDVAVGVGGGRAGHGHSCGRGPGPEEARTRPGRLPVMLGAVRGSALLDSCPVWSPVPSRS